MDKTYSTVGMRAIFHITQKEISEQFGIPLGTIKNWDSRETMPKYLHDMLWHLLEIRRSCEVLNNVEHTIYSMDDVRLQERRIGEDALRVLGYDFKDLGSGKYGYSRNSFENKKGEKND